MLNKLVYVYQFTKGKNYLHQAIVKGDLESVLFLLSVQVDVNARTRDSSQASPLQLATQAGSEMMVRNLVSSLNDVKVS